MIADRWGVRDDEVARHYTCDDLVTAPTLKAYRGVTVHATPECLWPWVAQIRLGPYSYDWIDNLGRRSPRELRGLPDPVVGEHYTVAFGRPAGELIAVNPGRELTGRIMGATMTYVLVPEDARTRLLLKVVANPGRVLTPLLSIGDLVMARHQLLNLKRLAERSMQ